MINLFFYILQQQAEMQTFLKSDADSLRHHFEKKIQELEEEKKTFQVRIFSKDSETDTGRSFICSV
jgi:hypothetical protein